MKFAFNIMVFLVCWVCHNSQAEPTPNIVNALHMEFVYIPPGSFWMGSAAKERGHEADELHHQVEISNGFYIQTTEVTRKQWKALMEGDPSSFPACGDSCPVDRLKPAWVDKFIEKLNARDGTYLYRLPTEAEWEYVAKAGSNTAFSTGSCLGESNAAYDASMPFGFCRQGAKHQGPSPVASFKPNPWGVYDMHGNVWEMCSDWYEEYDLANVRDPAGPAQGDYRVLRGSSWKFPEAFARSANRFKNIRDIAGFRLVMLKKQPE
ncbi:formylglycine-generating enzyme family protein [Ketobacter sp. MCCC 1A13808]|uniref:formylglycine-generating enzyme family protein n=1 Tax=Ketobacter sp. MCCC 1A13808 TaxID=2602738 RepID=UPI000F2776E5|nr:formylglycine-generating enzyme family protein [Ketobacter sp. MCCC 1A13808]MVF13063.1 formylglycine-generating enzyme family protein [Ketobacter sp. MCCC 1A13808]RLP53026.1 MAG: formylglycine-generating enzyme family protein [Ketobacter sp.]